MIGIENRDHSKRGAHFAVVDGGLGMDHAGMDLDAAPPSLAMPPLFAALAPARRVLIAGAGGGFDIYAGLPLAIALWSAGKDVHLANLSFAQLELLELDVWREND